MLSRDNQQVTRGWFVGILEGEGNFSNTSNTYVGITNLDLGIIESCESYLRANNIWFVRCTHHRNGRPEYRIGITNSGTQIYQYASILYDLIASSMDCRHNEFLKALGSSEITREPTIDRNWLAGIYEAEGSFGIYFDHRGAAQLVVQLPNKNLRIIKKIEQHLVDMFCGYHLRVKPPRLAHHTPGWIIAISGMKRCERFLESMVGYWVSPRNKKRASLMHQYIKLRTSHPMQDPYSEEELRLVQSLRDLNS